ncbi:Forkhead-associated (FHA) domain protein [Quillaja saponaria]|uniref:Forkhead-associated (FHA) domain protein n=1 Tax=Quillaja saponaria TaxID=32244 RepID=A0AAD7PJE6_QUISA|nr:Forkhead-associated (FHA) domain protein [Quillaja saponaria]
MGALASSTPWTPEDDFLLKNAVEAGASLESLAKGAVQFSQKFTFRELQDRWYSLLYDPVISAESSACMINFEHSVSSPASKFSKLGYSNANKRASVKRKAECVRNCYYALRKRIWNNHLSSMDLSFLVPPIDSNYVCNGGDPLYTNCMHEDPVANYFEPHGSIMDTEHCDLPENLMDGGAVTDGVITSCTFYVEMENPVVENFPVKQNSSCTELPPIFGETLSFDGNASGVEELDGSEELAVDSLFETDGFGDINFTTHDQVNCDHGNMYSEFNRNQVFDSPISECENDLCMGNRPNFPDGEAVNNVRTSSFGVVHSDTKVKLNNLCADDLRSSIASEEGYLVELSNSLLDFTNDEELFLMDIAGKEGFDKSYEGLSSLLKSPNDVNQDHTLMVTEPETSVAPPAYVTNARVSHPAEVDDNTGSWSSDGQLVHRSDIQMPSSATALDLKCPGLTGEETCMLNTEDPEIPSNDDVFLPFQNPPSTFPSSSQRSFQETYNRVSSSVEDVGATHRAYERGIGLMQTEQKSLVESPVCHHTSDCKVQFKSSNHASQVGSRGEVIGCSSSSGINSANASTKAPVPAKLKEEAIDIVAPKSLNSDSRNSFIEKTAHSSNSFRNYPHIDTSGMKQDQDVPITIQDHQSVHPEGGSADAIVSEPVVNPSTSDQELLHSDDDVPHYSDIEAMILDMDLDPDGQDLYCSEEVSRYQHEDNKRAIIRLEQGAHSYMQRAIASNGAFAVLYGRHSKHYIKKSEVLLGRASEDIIIDIDLSSERRANKLSRRQAIIKMDEVGSFYLRNLGKCSISVNNTDVPSGESLNLQSGCLIECICDQHYSISTL